VLGVSTGDRSPGLHASTIYNSLYQELEPKRYTADTPFDMARMDLGLTIEDMIEEGWKRRHQSERPGEFMTEEGIAFSPDGITFEPPRTLLTELKVTWMSCRECPISEAQSEQTKAFLAGKELKLPVTWDGVSAANFPPKLSKYFTQMKFYTRNLDLEWARLIVLFINADYRPSRPVVLAWDFLFTKRELEENHRMLINHAKHKGML
jgi:hypothetical protein